MGRDHGSRYECEFSVVLGRGQNSAYKEVIQPDRSANHAAISSAQSVHVGGTWPGHAVMAPLIRECLANIECRVIDIIGKHNIIVLEGLRAYIDESDPHKRGFHAVGDGTFIADGGHLDRRAMMQSKLPPGV
ncbi:MAG: flavin reductase [Burkholderiales bacterium]|nr:flavin reductase [Burkholderiales bacterium]